MSATEERKEDFEQVRKERRSFEERLRAALLKLENDGFVGASKDLIMELENQLMQRMANIYWKGNSFTSENKSL